MGAFGGTAEAELSVPAGVTGGPGGPSPTPSTPTGIPPAGSTPGEIAGGGSEGCAVGGRRSANTASWMLALLALTLVRRSRRRS
jgi:hypothetical protein